jgi:sugar phosphate isomerase/epimerase
MNGRMTLPPVVCQGIPCLRSLLLTVEKSANFHLTSEHCDHNRGESLIMLAFSTCWNSSRHTSGEALAREILDLGFDQIELGHGLKAHMVHELLAAQAKLSFSVSSLHNFCPLPPEVMVDQPDCYEFTSHRKEDRHRAIRLTMQTIDMAERFGARNVVIHSGRIRTMKHTRTLRRMVQKEGNFTKEYARAKLKAVQQREARSEAYIQRALECLIEIADYASKKGIRIGIENREHYEAMPSEREFANFLQRLDASNADYWHDFGHAQIKHNLGLLDHGEWLDRFASRAIGSHVHDVKWPFEDHCAPFTGEIPFGKFVPKFSPNCLFVFELHPFTTREDIMSAAQRWRQLFDS